MPRKQIDKVARNLHAIDTEFDPVRPPPRCQQQLSFFGEHAQPPDAKAFADYLVPLHKTRWFVYAKRPFAGPKAVLAYLSRHTHRVAISSWRLIACDDRRVTFKGKATRSKGPVGRRP